MNRLMKLAVLACSVVALAAAGMVHASRVEAPAPVQGQHAPTFTPAQQAQALRDAVASGGWTLTAAGRALVSSGMLPQAAQQVQPGSVSWTTVATRVAPRTTQSVKQTRRAMGVNQYLWFFCALYQHANALVTVGPGIYTGVSGDWLYPVGPTRERSLGGQQCSANQCMQYIVHWPPWGYVVNYFHVWGGTWMAVNSEWCAN